MADAARDQNFVPTLIAVSNADGLTPVKVFADPTTHRLLVNLGGGGSGTVTDVSVVTANGFAGSVATSTTTPAITLSTTITGILSGNGTAISAASTTGSGDVVLATSPTLVTPALGTPSALVGTNITGTASALNIGGTAAVATTSTIANEASDTTCFVTFTTAATGNLGLKSNTGLTFNSSTGALSATSFVGSITGNAATLTVANEATDTTCFIGFWTAASGSLPGKTNTNMTFNSSTGVATFASTVLTTTDINGGTIDGTVIGGSSAAAITGTAIIGNSFVPNSSTIPSNGLYLPAANTLGLAINSAAELQLTSTALSPAADGGSSLGTTTLGWQNLFANTGFVLNIENSNWVATHTSGILTVGTGDLRVTTAGTNTASVVTVGGTQTLTNKTLTSPTITTANLSGTQLLAEGASIGYDPSLSADGTWTGITMTGTAGYTQSFGDCVYLDPTDSRWEACDANAAAGADGDSRGTIGMVVVAGTDGNSCTILINGAIRADAKFPTFTVNNQIYVSETAGSVTQTQPTTTDVVIRVLGSALTADAMIFNPSYDFVTHT